jgi:hypothetical protein
MLGIEIKLCIFYIQTVMLDIFAENRMAKLTTEERNKIPKKEFAGPDRSYPVPDRSHAANAKARASQQYNKGHISLAMEHDIDAKANKVLK